MTGPAKFGLRDGRSGFLVSPSPDRFDPVCGVNEKPLNNVAIPFNCQPPINAFSSPRASLRNRLCLPKGSSYVAEMLDCAAGLSAEGPQSLRKSLRSITICA